MTVNNEVDYNALADKIASDEWQPSGPGVSIIDLAEVRAFELLRREYVEAIANAVESALRFGATWAGIAAALRVDEAEAKDAYATGSIRPSARPEDDPEPDDGIAMVDFMVRCRTDAERRLAGAIERAKAVGVDDRFIESVISWSDDEGRLR